MSAMAFDIPGTEDFSASSLDMGPPQWLDVDGIRTRYFDRGSGPAVVFFHGGHYGSADASSAGIWDVNFVPLSKFVNVIAVDRLGQGFTDNPAKDSDYTMQASVDHAARLLRRLGKGPYHVVGHSRGGYVVVRLALEHPDLVATAIPVSTGTLSPGFNRAHLIFSNLPNWSARASLRALLEAYSFNPRWITPAVLDEPERVLASERHRIAERKMRDGLETGLFLPELTRQRTEVHRWLLEKGIPCPTLICWGYRDPGAEFERGKQLIEMFMKHQRRTELCLFNRSGHYVYREYPEQFSRAVLSFVMAHA
jgi:pimeloyl-ACP methyl ester carboxylesterase